MAQLQLTPMEESPNSGAPLWLPKKDKSGTVFRKGIAEAAIKNWNRLRDYAARERIDSSFAADIVESIVKSMSAAQRRNGSGEVRNPDSYIYARFARRIKRLAIRERRIEYRGTLQDLDFCKAARDWEWPLRLENSIQAKEAVAYMDVDTRRTYWFRVHGLSWKEIARRQGVVRNTAIKAYERGLERTRERMRLNKRDSL